LKIVVRDMVLLLFGVGIGLVF
jgi:hypothetical protein